MIKKIIKFIIFFIFGNIIRLVFPVLLKKRSDNVYVLNYHYTYPKNQNKFIKQIKFLKKNFIFVDEKYLINDNLKIDKSTKPKLLITFDDAHISNYFTASKILDEHNIKAIFFVPVGFVDRKSQPTIEEEHYLTVNKFNILSDIENDIKNRYEKLSMTWSNIIDLKNRGHSIGSHSYSHIRLNDDLSSEQLEKEIAESKRIIQKKINNNVNSFCWVIGDLKSYSKNAFKYIFKANYKLSFMTCNKPFNKRQNLMQIHRFNIEDNFSIPRIIFVLSGIYELMYRKKRNLVNKITKIS